MLRALVFDLNGVLVDDEPLHLQLLQRVLAEEGTALPHGDYRAHYVGLDDRGCFAAALARAGRAAPAALLMRLVARKASYHQEVVRRHGFAFFPGAASLVHDAAERGIVLGLVSAAPREEVEQALRQEHMRECFKVLVTAEDVEVGKPHPEGYLTAIAELNSRPPLPERMLHPHEVLAIEDSPAGIEAAAAAGCLTLGVGHTYPLAEIAAADWVAPSLAGLTVAALLELQTVGGAGSSARASGKKYQFTGTRPANPSS